MLLASVVYNVSTHTQSVLLQYVGCVFYLLHLVLLIFF